MPKTAFVLGNPKTRLIEKKSLGSLLEILTDEWFDTHVDADFSPVILSVKYTGKKDLYCVVYAERYEVK